MSICLWSASPIAALLLIAVAPLPQVPVEEPRASTQSPATTTAVANRPNILVPHVLYEIHTADAPDKLLGFAFSDALDECTQRQIWVIDDAAGGALRLPFRLVRPLQQPYMSLAQFDVFARNRFADPGVPGNPVYVRVVGRHHQATVGSGIPTPLPEAEGLQGFLGSGNCPLPQQMATIRQLDGGTVGIIDQGGNRIGVMLVQSWGTGGNEYFLLSPSYASADLATLRFRSLSTGSPNIQTVQPAPADCVHRPDLWYVISAKAAHYCELDGTVPSPVPEVDVSAAPEPERP